MHILNQILASFKCDYFCFAGLFTKQNKKMKLALEEKERE